MISYKIVNVKDNNPKYVVSFKVGDIVVNVVADDRITSIRLAIQYIADVNNK